jgi:TP901 family phage tail tape measure protein
MMLRLGSAGQVAGLTNAEIAGLSAGLASLGVTAELGGNQFSRFINDVNIAVNTGNDNLAAFAETAGMSVDEFVRAFQTDAIGAIIAFVSGLSDIERHSKNTVQMLQELGFTNIRLADVLRRAAGSGDLLRSAVEMSSVAWAENTALTEEAGLKYASTESQMQVLTNRATELKIAIGDALTPAMNFFAGTIGGILGGMTEFAKRNEFLTKTFAALVVPLAAATAALVTFAAAKKALAALELKNTLDSIKTGFLGFGTSLGKPKLFNRASVSGFAA